MKLISNCFECLGNQISRLMISEKEKQQIFMELFKFAAKYKNLFNDTPVDLARIVYKNKVVIDFFKKAKENEINFSKEIAEKLSYENDLLHLLKIATALNVYDYSSPNFKEKWKEEINLIETMFDISELEKTSGNLLYLLDNCSEIAVDLLFLKKLKLKNKEIKITIMPRQHDFINDVTIDDLKEYNLIQQFKKISEIIPLDIYGNSKSKEAIKIKDLKDFIDNNFDYVISKGQANYEILSEFKFKRAKIIIALIAKCEVVAKELNITPGKGIIKLLNS
ncbi:MAG: ARMT1-like domain-containing protein [Candidatus Woesearchaeota archaeon]